MCRQTSYISQSALIDQYLDTEEKKVSKLAEKFKGSILGADIGVKSGGFSTIAILATVIALAVLAALYFIWRF